MSPRCTARKKNGEPCKALAIGGTTKCHYHGGKSLSGIASPSFRHGRYSKSLPGGLRQLAERAASDPRLTELTDEIAIVQARLHQLLSRADESANPRTITEAWRAMKGAMDAKDTAGFHAAASRMDAALSAANRDADLWQEIDRTLSRLAHLVKTETARRIETEAYIPVAHAARFAHAVLVAVLNHEPDLGIRARIQDDIARAIGEHRIDPDADIRADC
jgi:hypothetical protein